MTTRDPAVRAMEDPEGQLERALMEEFLRSRGMTSSSLHTLAEDEAKHIMAEAAAYAAGRLAEIEARAHFVHEIHSDE